MIESTMQDFPLTITHLFRHGRRVHGRSKVLTYAPGGADGDFAEATFAEVGDRADPTRGGPAAARPSSRVIGSARSCGTTRRTSRPTAIPAWVRSCTP
ncbi:MAG: hypothetical protein R2710_20335 [Acidimicrobiales bacterium]